MSSWFLLMFFDDILISDPNNILHVCYQNYYTNKMKLFTSRNNYFDSLLDKYYLKRNKHLNHLDGSLYNIKINHSLDINVIYNTPNNKIPVYCEIYLNCDYLNYLLKSETMIPDYFLLCNILKNRLDEK